MSIKIAERLRPFSHSPGVLCLLPGSSFAIECFPTLLVVNDLSHTMPIEISRISVNIQGPVENFTVLQDLEKGELSVWGDSLDGYFRYRLIAAEKIAIVVEREPEKGLIFSPSPHFQVFSKKNPPPTNQLPTLDRLSLGNHKAQDWDLVCRRLDMAEIFPAWHRLGQMISCPDDKNFPGLASFLNQCAEKIKANAPEEILPTFRQLFRIGFKGIMTPTLIDEKHQTADFQTVEQSQKGSPLILLKRGSELIRSLFVQVEDHSIQILPALPPEFHCGRLINVSTKFGSLDLEWSKKTIRQMILKPSSSESLDFCFPKGIKRFRLREGIQDRGKILTNSSQIKIDPSHHYFFDNFQH